MCFCGGNCFFGARGFPPIPKPESLLHSQKTKMTSCWKSPYIFVGDTSTHSWMIFQLDVMLVFKGVFSVFLRGFPWLFHHEIGVTHRRFGRYKLAFKSLVTPKPMSLVIREAMVCNHTPADLQKSRIKNINCRLVNLKQASGSIHCNQNYRIVDQVIQVNKIFITKDLLNKLLKWYFGQTFFKWMFPPPKKKTIMEKTQVDETSSFYSLCRWYSSSMYIPGWWFRNSGWFSSPRICHLYVSTTDKVGPELSCLNGVRSGVTNL